MGRVKGQRRRLQLKGWEEEKIPEVKRRKDRKEGDIGELGTG